MDARLAGRLACWWVAGCLARTHSRTLVPTHPRTHEHTIIVVISVRSSLTACSCRRFSCLSSSSKAEASSCWVPSPSDRAAPSNACRHTAGSLVHCTKWHRLPVCTCLGHAFGEAELCIAWEWRPFDQILLNRVQTRTAVQPMSSNNTLALADHPCVRLMPWQVGQGSNARGSVRTNCNGPFQPIFRTKKQKRSDFKRDCLPCFPGAKSKFGHETGAGPGRNSAWVAYGLGNPPPWV